MKYLLLLVAVNVVFLVFVWPATAATDPHLAHVGTTLAVIGIVSGVLGVLCKAARR